MSQLKNETTIKSLLGLSQEETALLLGITRTQWAMFTSGKRDIPLNAKQHLANVITHLQKNKTASPASAKLLAAEKKKAQDRLQQEYKTIIHKQQFLERQLKTMTNIRKECYASLEVVAYLESQNEDLLLKNLAESIKIRVTATLTKHSLVRMQELEFKQNSLEMLKSLIDKKMKI